MIRAVLFDMDGVLFDTEELGYRAISQIAAEYGFRADRAFYQKTLGVPNAECEGIYLAELGSDFPYQAVMRRFRDYFRDYIQKQALPYKPGLMECLTGLTARGIKLALATSTVRPLVDAYFAKMPAIAAQFSATVCGGEVPRGKPAPDVYLAAANAVGCAPAECIGVEDSFYGVQAIRASGAYAVMVPDMLPYGERFAPYVDACLNSLLDICPLVDRLNARHG